MIVLKQLEQIMGEEKTLPLEKGGELEQYIARAVQQHILHNFGIIAECEVKGE